MAWLGDRKSLIRDGIGTTVAALLALPFDSALTTLAREAPDAFGRIGRDIGSLRGYSGSAARPELGASLHPFGEGGDTDESSPRLVRSRQGTPNSLVDQGLGLFVVLSPDSFSSSTSFKSRCMARPRFPPGVGGRGGGRTEEGGEGELNLTDGLDDTEGGGGTRAAPPCVEPKNPSCLPALECERTSPAPPLGTIWEELEVLTRLVPLS